MKISQWRTVAVVLVLAGLGLFGFVRLLSAPGEFAVRAYDTFAWTLLGLGAIAGGKSAIEHLGRGAGVKGALAALLTDSKPGDPPPPAPPAGNP